MIDGKVLEDKVKYPGQSLPPPPVLADPGLVRQALAVLFAAKKPLVIIGKGEFKCVNFLDYRV